MSRYVTVSALSTSEHAVGTDSDPQKIVERMKQYWRGRLQLVLMDKPDLIVLPEVCDRPNLKPVERRLEYYHRRGNQMRDFFASIAHEHQCYIAYSAVIEMNDGSFRNATQLLDRQGNVVGVYYKNYPTEGEMTAGAIVCGQQAPVFECDFGRVACVICYDLNFSELMRHYENNKPEIIAFSSNFHGGLIASTWAYRCEAYFVGALGVRFPSYQLSPLGQLLGETTGHHPTITLDLNLDYCVAATNYNLKALRAAKRKYGRKIKIIDPGKIDSCLLTSETDEFTIGEIVKEFGILTPAESFDLVRQRRERER